MIENKKNNKLKIVIVLVLSILSLMPLFRGYVGNTGESLLWCLRLSRVLPVNMVEPALIIGIGILRILLVFASFLLFSVLNGKEKDSNLSDIVGVSLFVFSPYQLYIAYDKVDITDMLLWITILLFATAILFGIKAIREKKNIITFLMILLCICLVAVMALTYLLSHISESSLSFEGQGYVFGEMFTSFFYQENHPGFGVALIGSIGVWLYYWIVEIAKKEEKKESKDNNGIQIVFFVLSIIFLCMASVNFPWDSISREIMFMNKVITRLESPTIFLGLSGFCFTVPAIKGISLISKSDNEFASKVVPVMVSLISVSIGIFLMSEYMYWQSPLGFANM